MSSHAVQKPQITSTGDRLPNMPFSLMLMQIDPTCSGVTPDFGLVSLYLFACSTQLLLRCLYSVSCTRHHLILASNLHHDLWRSCGVSRRLSGAYGLVHRGCLPWNYSEVRRSFTDLRSALNSASSPPVVKQFLLIPIFSQEGECMTN